MKLAHSSVIVVAFAATAAHAQLNLLGVIQSAQSAIAQGTSPGKPDIPSGTALLQQAKGLAAQQVWAQKTVVINGVQGLRSTSGFDRCFPAEFELFDHIRVNRTPNMALAFPRPVRQECRVFNRATKS